MIDIQDINRWHRDAMGHVDLALDARRRQDAKQESLHFRNAYDLEAAAAMGLVTNGHEEPARSVLLRSAAALALDCQLPREAEKLISIALAGEPPDEIAEELRNLNEQANFHRHLALQGITLEGMRCNCPFPVMRLGMGLPRRGAGEYE